MSNDDRLLRLRSVIGDVTKRDASNLGLDDDLIFELGLDSMEGLRVMALIEKRFQMRFDDLELHGLRTLRQLADAVARRTS